MKQENIEAIISNQELQHIFVILIITYLQLILDFPIIAHNSREAQSDRNQRACSAGNVSILGTPYS